MRQIMVDAQSRTEFSELPDTLIVGAQEDSFIKHGSSISTGKAIEEIFLVEQIRRKRDIKEVLEVKERT